MHEQLTYISARALKLMNHMKLYINRPNTKKDKKIDRKKKEQESAEAFQRTKNYRTKIGIIFCICVHLQDTISKEHLGRSAFLHMLSISKCLLFSRLSFEEIISYRERN